MKQEEELLKNSSRGIVSVSVWIRFFHDNNFSQLAGFTIEIFLGFT
jgi:hypothetical protein